MPEHDELATEVLIDVMRRLHRPAPADLALPDPWQRGAAFTRYLRHHPGSGPLPRHLVDQARVLLADLCASATERVVLHGVLHHDNVVSADREQWLTIDPHGVVGDPGYDVGKLLSTPDLTSRDDTLMSLLLARVEHLADGVAMPVERVVTWGFVQAMLSEVWTAESGGVISRCEVALALLPGLP